MGDIVDNDGFKANVGVDYDRSTEDGVRYWVYRTGSEGSDSQGDEGYRDELWKMLAGTVRKGRRWGEGRGKYPFERPVVGAMRGVRIGDFGGIIYYLLLVPAPKPKTRVAKEYWFPE